MVGCVVIMWIYSWLCRNGGGYMVGCVVIVVGCVVMVVDIWLFV